jgi:hypothetical protein
MGVSGLRHAPAAIYPWERTPGTHCTGDWVGPRPDLDTEAREKILCLCRESNLDRPVVQSVARHCTDCATPARCKVEYRGKIFSVFHITVRYLISNSRTKPSCYRFPFSRVAKSNILRKKWLIDFCVLTAYFELCVLYSVNVWMTVNDEFKGITKEAGISHFNARSQHLSGKTKEKHEIYQSI